VDILAGLAHVVHPQDGIVATSYLSPPWGLCFLDRSPLAIEIVVRGDAWLRPDADVPLHLHTGDIGLINGGTSYVLADSVDTPPGAVIYGPGRTAAADEPAAMAADRWQLPAPRTYGHSIDAPTVVIRGAYRSHNPTGRRLLHSLPRTARIPATRLPRSLHQLLEEEATRADTPGHHTVLGRLLDLLLVLTLRAWLQDPKLTLPGWYRALTHPTLGRALQAIHDHPDRAWTVADLARLAGLSRASFAATFHTHVGQPPIAYLTEWRMELAANLLSDTDNTLATIARTVGYRDGYALSTAFRRVTGTSPAAYRSQSTGQQRQRPAMTPAHDTTDPI
jgi:AraC-like DNA-binding protein